jgi:hypothetical protein
VEIGGMGKKEKTGFLPLLINSIATVKLYTKNGAKL